LLVYVRELRETAHEELQDSYGITDTLFVYRNGRIEKFTP